MPVPHGTGCSYFDGPPIVSSWGFCVHDGKLTEPVDNFAHPFWDAVRTRAAEKSMEMRRQGFSGPAMLNINELEYGGIVKILKNLDRRFTIRPAARQTEAIVV
jgi:fructose 1,6-bisphosphate aldolase/phosphatase